MRISPLSQAISGAKEQINGLTRKDKVNFPGGNGKVDKKNSTRIQVSSNSFVVVKDINYTGKSLIPILTNCNATCIRVGLRKE